MEYPPPAGEKLLLQPQEGKPKDSAPGPLGDSCSQKHSKCFFLQDHPASG